MATKTDTPNFPPERFWIRRMRWGPGTTCHWHMNTQKTQLWNESWGVWTAWARPTAYGLPLKCCQCHCPSQVIPAGQKRQLYNLPLPEQTATSHTFLLFRDINRQLPGALSKTPYISILTYNQNKLQHCSHEHFDLLLLFFKFESSSRVWLSCWG